MLIFHLFVIFFITNTCGLNYRIITKTRFKNVVFVKHFWQSTGLCPTSERQNAAEFLLSQDEKLNLNYIGALPNEGIKFIRIHWLLDLVKVRDVKSNNESIFDFEALDLLIGRLHENNLHPVFELMGNPSNYFSDFKKQSQIWTNLIVEIIDRYNKIYGAWYVRTWKFELMNEPDLKLYNFFNFTLENYLEYFRASQSAGPSLMGPAGLFRENRKVHSLCWGLLDYCQVNSCNLDTITFHGKGEGRGSRVVEKSLELINMLIENYPNMKGIAFGNDEADILTGWSKPLEWRADVRYGALVAQVVIGHIREMFAIRNILFEILSNDNAFLSYYPHQFTQRTLLARFQMNNTNPPHVQFFKKPVYTIMSLLSLLGNYVKDIYYGPGEEGLSYILTSYGFQDVFLGVLTDDQVRNETYVVDSKKYANISVKIPLADLGLSGIYVVYNVDNLHNNPYQVWKDLGKPDFPNFEHRKRMREAEGVSRLSINDIKPHQSHVKVMLTDILVPSVFSISICFEGTEEPGPVSGLRFEKIFKNEILLLWKDTVVGSRCLLTYTVEFRCDGDDKFSRINGNDSLFLSYHFNGFNPEGSFVGIKGEYRVAAVDYWNRTGPFSDILIVFD